MIEYTDTIYDFSDFKKIVIPPYSTADRVIDRVEREGLEKEFMEYLTGIYHACAFVPTVAWWEQYIIESEEEIYKELGI